MCFDVHIYTVYKQNTTVRAYNNFMIHSTVEIIFVNKLQQQRICCCVQYATYSRIIIDVTAAIVLLQLR